MVSKAGKAVWLVWVWCALLGCTSKPVVSEDKPTTTTPPPPGLGRAETAQRARLDPLESVDALEIGSHFYRNLERAPKDYASLAATLGSPPDASGPNLDVKGARFFKLVTRKLQLEPEQIAQLARNGAITVQLPDSPTMGSAYAALWHADLPVVITTDSILHAWHKTYDNTLERLEVTTFTDAYRSFLDEVALAMQRSLHEPSPKLEAAARRLDLYLTVARTLLSRDNPRRGLGRRGVDPNPPAIVNPQLVSRAEVEQVVRAIYAQRDQTVPLLGDVDFSQFKPRGHYTNTDELARYFRALMWMGRADTGFDLAEPESARAALMLAVFARQSQSVSAFAQVQATIDFFVGTSNGLSLTTVVDVLRKHQLTELVALEDDARTSALARELLAATPQTRVTSQAVLSQGKDTPPPAIFQLSSQRFTLDSYVHQRVSYDRIDDRLMVDGLDVFAAMGNAEATRLLEPELAKYAYSDEMHALRATISGLPAAYWQKNLYTRWFDVLRTLDDIPEGPYLPNFFRSQIWQRKQLTNQLASWAELRRDTILYVAQGYAGVACEFPDVYLEPYPDFLARMGAMAREASGRLDDAHLRGFADVMDRLAGIATRQLDEKRRNEADRAYLKTLVRSDEVGGCGGSKTVWSGWYRELYPLAEMFDFEPVIADVFTNPNSGAVLNVATTGPDLLVAAIRTQDGPTLFVGPVSGFRQFVGARTNDQEWEARVQSGNLPPPEAWDTLHAGGGALPIPHDAR